MAKRNTKGNLSKTKKDIDTIKRQNRWSGHLDIWICLEKYKKSICIKQRGTILYIPNIYKYI